MAYTAKSSLNITLKSRRKCKKEKIVLFRVRRSSGMKNIFRAKTSWQGLGRKEMAEVFSTKNMKILKTMLTTGSIQWP